MKSITDLIKENYSIELRSVDGKEVRLIMRKGNRGIESWLPIADICDDTVLLKEIYECKSSIEEQLKM